MNFIDEYYQNTQNQIQVKKIPVIVISSDEEEEDQQHFDKTFEEDISNQESSTNLPSISNSISKKCVNKNILASHSKTIKKNIKKIQYKEDKLIQSFKRPHVQANYYGFVDLQQISQGKVIKKYRFLSFKDSEMGISSKIQALTKKTGGADNDKNSDDEQIKQAITYNYRKIKEALKQNIIEREKQNKENIINKTVEITQENQKININNNTKQQQQQQQNNQNNFKNTFNPNYTIKTRGILQSIQNQQNI